MTLPLPPASAKLKTIFLLNLFLVTFLAFDLNASSGYSDPPVCRKYEERLYLNSLLKTPGSTEHYIDSLRSCMNESPDLYLSLGKYFYKRDQYKEAATEFEKVLNLSPVKNDQLAEAYYYLSSVAYQLKKYEDCIKYANSAQQKGFNASWVLRNKGMAYQMMNDVDESFKMYNKAAAADPNNDAAIYDIGSYYFNKHNYKISLHYYLLADSIANGNVGFYKWGIIRSYTELQRPLEAKAATLAAYKKFPEDKGVIEQYAKLLCDENKFSDALVFARKLLRLKPQTSNQWFSIAYIYNEAGEYDSSFYYYNIALKYDPNYAAAHANIGLIYRKYGLFEQAHAKLDKAISIDSNIHYHYAQKQSIYMWQHDFENAYLWAKKLNDHFPDRKPDIFRLAYALQQLKRYDEAIVYFKQALEEDPKDDRLINNIGRCYAGLKKYDMAGEYFAQAMKINPDNSFIYHNRAAYYYDLGKFDLACADLNTAMQKEYNWIIDEKLLTMKAKYCPEVNTDRKIIIYEYKQNLPELSRLNFIQLNDSSLKKLMDNVPTASENKKTTTQTEANSFDGAFTVFPNPSNGKFSIKNTNPTEEMLLIKVFNENGVLVQSEETNKGVTDIILKNPLKGIYVVMILDRQSVLSAKKLVIE